MERQLPEIVAAFNQDVEGAQLHLVVVLAGVQRVEVGNAIDAEDHRLARRVRTTSGGWSYAPPRPSMLRD
jgi:hypothetical protein